MRIDVDDAGVRLALRRLEGEIPRIQTESGMKAARMIARDARGKVPLGPAEGGHARSSVVAQMTSIGPQVTGGGSRFPYFGWLDFGGRVGINDSVFRPFLKTGRYIWRSYADSALRVRLIMRDELADGARRSGLEVDE